MRRLLAILVLVSLIFTLSSCRRFNRCGDFCYPTFVPDGPWRKELPGGPWDEDCQGIIDNEEVTRIVLTYARELKDKHKLKLHDSRVYYKDTMYKLRLDFTSMQITELCPVRHLLYDIVEGYLSRINRNGILRGEVSNLPFTEMNLEIHIAFESFYVRFVDLMDIQWVTLEDGTSYFYNAEVGDRNTDYWHKHIEPYYKTRQIVEIEKEIGPEKDVEKDRYNTLETKLFNTSPDEIL